MTRRKMENWDAVKKRRHPKRRRNEFRQEEGDPKNNLTNEPSLVYQREKGNTFTSQQQQKVIHFKGEKKNRRPRKESSGPKRKNGDMILIFPQAFT